MAMGVGVGLAQAKSAANSENIIVRRALTAPSVAGEARAGNASNTRALDAAMITDAEIGKALRRLRLQSGLSMARLAPSAGLCKGGLLKREQGKTSTTAAELFSLCAALGVQPNCVIEIVQATRRGRELVPESPIVELRRELARARAGGEQRADHPQQRLDW
jgi:transcriptional regulator with XRE-family HTH domain